MYDYLIVGSGLFGSIFSHQMKSFGYKVLIVEKRNHIGGNVYDENIDNILVHKYGPHSFHTNDINVWNYVNKFSKFISYNHQVKACYENKIYSLPFNLHTFQELWNCNTPKEAQLELNKRKIKINNPQNLEEYALSQVGKEIYDKFIYHYTKKQWGCSPQNLPISIIKRIPISFNFDNRYHKDMFQGIPINGFTKLIENIINDIEIKQEDFFDIKWKNIAKKLVYTGPIDKFFNYKYGKLEYRSLKFKHKKIKGNYQGITQINYTSNEKYTRIIEHKHFYNQNNENSIITHEYPCNSDESYYPINNNKNNKIYNKYKRIIPNDIIISGRLGEYKYLNMDQIVSLALKKSKEEYERRNK